ncbi:hypothetical protein [Epilithonimonas sp.]|uniref:hypothetical protein n=1 Tax=Epilithonimonas sp. TaxID=2894511 RepID=UPI002FDE4568
MIGSVFLQNCVQRDEDTIANNNVQDEVKNNLQMRSDSTKSSEEIVDPDPPVRDGDNWRYQPKNK